MNRVTATSLADTLVNATADACRAGLSDEDAILALHATLFAAFTLFPAAAMTPRMRVVKACSEEANAALIALAGQ